MLCPPPPLLQGLPAPAQAAVGALFAAVTLGHPKVALLLLDRTGDTPATGAAGAALLQSAGQRRDWGLFSALGCRLQ